MRDERLVLDLCGDGHCDPDGVVGRTVCGSHLSDECSRQKETDENAAQATSSGRMSSSIVRRYSRSRLCVESLLRVMRNDGIADMRSARIVWTAPRSNLSV